MHFNIKLFSLFLILIIAKLQLDSQERIGLLYGNYNGINASQLNPSYLLRSQNKWEVQIVGLHSFFETNYGHINSSSLYDAISNQELLTIPDIPFDDVANAQQHDVIFNSENIKTFFDAKTDLLGPGGFFKISNNKAIGFSTKIRGSITSFEVPSSLNYYTVKDLPGHKEFTANRFQLNALVWSEYAIHYAQSIGKLELGVNLKYINGYTSFSFDNNYDIDYIERSDTLIALEKGQFSFTDPTNRNEQPDVIGNGLGIDIGINYLNNDGSYIGFSIIDLGYVNLNGKNYTVNFEANQFIIYSDYNFVKSVNDQIQQMIRDGFAIDSTEGHSVILPTAISFQYQKTFENKIGIQAHWIQNLRLSDYQIRHSNSLTISATYDKKHFSAFIPVTMYNYTKVRIGAAIRVGFLTLGSDKVFSLFNKQEEFSGSDFYLNLKFYPFKIRHNTKQKVNCFNF